MGVTIYDLAREAGVGIGTVSRCLNNHPSVSARTRERVLSVVRRLEYQPHTHARRLASKRTNTIAAIIPFFTNYFSIQVLQGVQDKVSELDIDLILYGVNHPAEVEEYLRRSLQRGHVDGVLFISMRFPDSYVTKCHQLRLPVVLIDAYHSEFDSIRVENKEGAMTATRHLIGLGHRQIALINASLETLPAQERQQGYRAALLEAGLPYVRENIIASGAMRQDGFNRDSGAMAMRQLLPAFARPDPVTAVFVVSDIQALGALDAARKAGIRVPGDVAIVSFDDIELAQHAGLTTMRQPMHQMGMLAVECLTTRMGNPDGPVTLTTFHPDLVIRDTCGAHASRPGRPFAPVPDVAHEQTV
jgi:LacI family transcriptional regulator